MITLFINTVHTTNENELYPVKANYEIFYPVLKPYSYHLLNHLQHFTVLYIFQSFTKSDQFVRYDFVEYISYWKSSSTAFCLRLFAVFRIGIRSLINWKSKTYTWWIPPFKSILYEVKIYSWIEYWISASFFIDSMIHKAIHIERLQIAFQIN